MLVEGQEERVLAEFSREYGIHFNDLGQLKLALTHRSYLHVTGQRDSNERLEFLGDSVLGLVTSEHLYKAHPTEHEGQLTKTKSLLVSKAILSRRALAMGLGRFVLLSHSEMESGGRQRLSILADAFEAVIGAIYLDQGFEAARSFIERWLLRDTRSIVSDKRHTNYKSHLQEYVQSTYRTHPVYRIRSEMGPDHSKQFMVEVIVGRRTLGEGKGRNKKEAEQAAARDALERVEAGPASDRSLKATMRKPDRPLAGAREPREDREPRETREDRELREPRETREARDAHGPRDHRETREPREDRETRDAHGSREDRETRDAHGPREDRETREPRETVTPPGGSMDLPESDDDGEGGSRRRRRGRRGGRGRRRPSGEGGPSAMPSNSESPTDDDSDSPVAEPPAPILPRPRREPRPVIERPVETFEPLPVEFEPRPPAYLEDDVEEIGRPEGPWGEPSTWNAPMDTSVEEPATAPEPRTPLFDPAADVEPEEVFEAPAEPIAEELLESHDDRPPALERPSAAPPPPRPAYGRRPGRGSGRR